MENERVCNVVQAAFSLGPHTPIQLRSEGFQPRTPIRGPGGKNFFLCGFH